MNINEFNQLFPCVPVATTINSNELQNKTPRTLLYGYNCDRDTLHVYLNKHGEIAVVWYDRVKDSPITMLEKFEWEVDALIPNKRLYPDRCDFEFCNLLLSKGFPLPFTTFNPEGVMGAQFHGKCIEEFNVKL